MCLFASERKRNCARGCHGVCPPACGIIDWQRRHRLLGFVQPKSQLLPKLGGLGMFLQTLGPVLEGGCLGWKRYRLTSSELAVGCVKIFYQNAPGHSVDREVMDDDK